MHYCSKCGNQLQDGVKFCTSCGAPQNVQQNENVAFNSNPTPEQSFNQTFDSSASGFNPNVGAQYAVPQTPKISDWDGGVLDTIVNSIIASLIISVTCGIATPWAICYIYKFVISHVLVDGRRLRFDGNGGQLFANWIKWFILIVITCGIYSFWVTPRLYKWIASHTHFE